MPGLTLTNNDILRRLRYAFDFEDAAMIAIFAAADHTVTRSQLSNWLKQEEDDDYEKASDTELAIFLNGFINTKRGKREGAQPEPEKRLTNNMIFVKLRIALSLNSEDILKILQARGHELSKHELTAFFRKPGNKHYRECKDQILRNFLMGIQTQARPAAAYQNFGAKPELADSALDSAPDSE